MSNSVEVAEAYTPGVKGSSSEGSGINPTYEFVLSCSTSAHTGWPRHRENREFGSYFFQTGKTQGILL